MSDISVREPTAEARAVEVRYRQADGVFAETSWDLLVSDEVEAGLPVREFRWYKGRRHYSGWYHAVTGDRLVAYESRLELARIVLADFAQDVVGIAAQPFQVCGDDGVRIRRHVPDLLLRHADGLVTVVDVKAPYRVDVPEARGPVRLDTEAVFAAGLGLRGVVWCQPCPRGEPPVPGRLPARPERVAVHLSAEVLEAAQVQASVGGIERALAARHPADLVRPALLRLVWSDALSADLSRPLSAQTPVRPAGEETLER
jgi:hypothetical protein